MGTGGMNKWAQNRGLGAILWSTCVSTYVYVHVSMSVLVIHIPL